MSARSYRLGYRWLVEGPIETVFHYVGDSRTFRQWFPVFKEVSQDEPQAPVRVGSHSRYRVQALLPYTLDWDVTVSRYEPYRLIETDCTVSLNGRFRLRGFVRYRFEQCGPLVRVTNEQELTPDRPLPGALHRLAQAVFSFNHDWAMARAAPGLQRVVRQDGKLP
jgi:uncharacterized protein YndB with AHSA1/START domain